MSALVVFTLDGRGYALDLSSVSRVVRAVEIAKLPKAPAIVLGVINVHGRVVPVVDVRARFDLPPRDLSPDDQLIIAHTGEREVALVVDSVAGTAVCPPEALIAPDHVAQGLQHVSGIAKLADGLTFIHDLGTFLSLDEKATLDRALDE